MSDLYTKEFLYHYKNQPNNKKLVNPNLSGRGTNISCGDEIAFELSISNGIVTDVGYQYDSCIISAASVSVLSQALVGMPVDEIKRMTEDRYLDLMSIELTPARRKCALVGYYALMDAVKGV